MTSAIATSSPTLPLTSTRLGSTLWAAILAIAAPTLLAFNEPPSATFFNQALSLIGWGVWCVALGFGLTGKLSRQANSIGIWSLGAAGLAMIGGVVWSSQWGSLPWNMAWSAIGMLLAALLVFATAWLVAAHGKGEEAFANCCHALVITALLGLVIGLIQVFLPELPGKIGQGSLIAPSSFVGRAVSNLRQPNHFNTLLLWGCVAAVWLANMGLLRKWFAIILMVCFVFAMVLTASRTAYLGLAVLVAWGLLDRSLSPALRRTLWALPVAYALWWALMALLAHTGVASFGAEARLHDGSDISSSRFKVWHDTLMLIRMHPLTGVGFGEFNFAWSLTPFPNRAIAFFDHTHNLELQLAVELGLPLATLVIGLLGIGLVSLVKNALADDGDKQPAIGKSGARAALVMVLLVGIHSQLEYPLWYAYFLLPTVFVWGLGLARGASDAAVANALPASSNELGAATPAVPPASEPVRVGMMTASLLLVFGSIAAVADYLTVVSIFAPLKNAAPLEQRIARGQKSPLFGYQADYAAATTADDPAQAFNAFNRPLHNLIDTRLMIAYADALNERGEVNKARHVVARLREFRRYGNEAFLDECNEVAPGETPPYQCTPPSGKPLDYRDFRQRNR